MRAGFLFFLIHMLYSTASLRSQNIEWRGKPLDVQQFQEAFEKPKTVQKQTVYEALQQAQKSLIGSGYLLASVDSVVSDSLSKQFFIYVSLGEKFLWAKLSPGNVDEGYLSKSGFRDRLFNNRAFSPEKVEDLLNNVLSEYENNGFPFAQISLVNAQIKPYGIEADLHIEIQKPVFVDTLVFHSDAKISDSYLYRYLGFKNEMAYNEQKFQTIDKNINDIPFLQSARPAEVVFSDNKARIDVYFQKKNASSFNGLIGFLPDEETGDVTISGDVKLNLINTFGKAERLKLNWRRLKTNTQELTLDLSIPYLFKTPLGVSGNFEIYRRDSTFNTVNFKGGIQYLFSRGNFLEGYLENNQSNALTNADLNNATSLPANSTVEVISYGMRYVGDFLDYRFNPSKGISLESKVSVGDKNIQPPNDDFTPLYDSLVLESEIYKARTDISAYLPLIPRTTLKFRVQAGHIINDQLFTNELFRLGGINTLRGFDEEVIFASSFAIPSVEFRYLLERNSYLTAFFDYAWYQRITLSESISDRPFGFGAGLAFETNAGIFSLFYALGKQFDNPIEFRSGKIHFGFTSLF